MVHEGETGYMAGKPHERPNIPARCEKFPRKLRLTKSRFFREAYAQKQRWVGKYMVLWLRKGEGADVRLGVVSSRKVGNAVRRNKARRRIREIYRKNRWQFREGPYDLVLVSRYAIVEAPWDLVVREFLKLAKKAGILVEPEVEEK